ncbi:hypothetical protein LI811_002074 [Salmonella enterica]|nr:hypothetical protein [Salmonella enterica]
MGIKGRFILTCVSYSFFMEMSGWVAFTTLFNYIAYDSKLIYESTFYLYFSYTFAAILSSILTIKYTKNLTITYFVLMLVLFLISHFFLAISSSLFALMISLSLQSFSMSATSIYFNKIVCQNFYLCNTSHVLSFCALFKNLARVIAPWGGVIIASSFGDFYSYIFSLVLALISISIILTVIKPPKVNSDVDLTFSNKTVDDNTQASSFKTVLFIAFINTMAYTCLSYQNPMIFKNLGYNKYFIANIISISSLGSIISTFPLLSKDLFIKRWVKHSYLMLSLTLFIYFLLSLTMKFINIENAYFLILILFFVVSYLTSRVKLITSQYIITLNVTNILSASAVIQTVSSSSLLLSSLIGFIIVKNSTFGLEYLWLSIILFIVCYIGFFYYKLR